MRRALGVLGSLLVVSAGGMLTSLPASAGALDDAFTALPVSARDVYVDDALDRVFVSGGNRVEVYDAFAHRIATIPDVYGAGDMVADGDGRLWVLMDTGDGIMEIDRDTLATTEHPLPSGLEPTELAFAGGLLWCVAAGGLTTVDVTSDDVQSVQVGGRVDSLLSDPAYPDVLFVGRPYAQASSYDVSGGPGEMVLLGQSESGLGLSFLEPGLAVTRWGSLVSIPSLEPAGFSPLRGTVARAPGGMVARIWKHGVTVYRDSSGEFYSRYSYDWGLQDRLGFVDGRLVVVTSDRIASIEVRQGSRLTPTWPPDRDLVAGGELPFSLRLLSPSANREVRVRATYTDGRTEALGSFKVPADRKAELSVRLRENARLTLEYDGDANVDGVRWVTKLRHVDARVRARLKDADGRRGKYALYGHTRTAELAVTVRPLREGGCAKVQVERYRDGWWRPSGEPTCVALDESGRAHLGLPGSEAVVGQHYRMRARVGAAENSEAGRSPWRYVEFVK